MLDTLVFHYIPKQGRWPHRVETELCIRSRSGLDRPNPDTATWDQATTVWAQPVMNRRHHERALHNDGCAHQTQTSLPCH